MLFKFLLQLQLQLVLPLRVLIHLVAVEKLLSKDVFAVLDLFDALVYYCILLVFSFLPSLNFLEVIL